MYICVVVVIVVAVVIVSITGAFVGVVIIVVAVVIVVVTAAAIVVVICIGFVDIICRWSLFWRFCKCRQRKAGIMCDFTAAAAQHRWRWKFNHECGTYIYIRRV